MQISNSLLVVCVAAAACVVAVSHAQDSQGQAKARAAMRQKLAELERQSPEAAQPAAAQVPAAQPKTTSAPAAQPVAVQPPAAKPAVRPAPSPGEAPKGITPAARPLVVQVPAQQVPAPIASAMSDPEAAAKARTALRQKIAELESQGLVGIPVYKGKPAFCAVPPSSKVVEPEAFAKKLAELPTDAQRAATDTKAKADKVVAETKAKTEKAAQAQPAESKKVASIPKGPLSFKPLEAPALPISAEKQQLLSELLRKYKADEMTPEQYHQERAKILAGQ